LAPETSDGSLGNSHLLNRDKVFLRSSERVLARPTARANSAIFIAIDTGGRVGARWSDLRVMKRAMSNEAIYEQRSDEERETGDVSLVCQGG
jgi:hypothetical protein